MGKKKWVKPEMTLITPDGRQIPLTDLTNEEMDLLIKEQKGQADASEEMEMAEGVTP